jgi:hypothetical protein
VLIFIISMMGCLERVTGEVIPLDPEFTRQASDDTGEGVVDDTAAAPHNSVEHSIIEHKEKPPPQPFADDEGERVSIRGLVTSEVEGSVDLDVATIDASAPGGSVQEGKLMYAAPGEFVIDVPVGTGEVMLSAFQDLDKDGPSAVDPFAEIKITVESEPIEGIVLALVKGARDEGMTGPVHVEMPHGAGSSEGSSDATQGDVDLFEGMEGDRIMVSGTIEWSGTEVVDVDLFTPDLELAGGRKLLGKFKKTAGAFELSVPVSIGELELEVFVDLDQDGPSPEDPNAIVRGINVSDGDVGGVLLTLEQSPEVTPAPEANAEGTDLDDEFSRTRAGGETRVKSKDGL